MRTVALANVLRQWGWRITFATTATSLKMANTMGLNEFESIILPDDCIRDPQILTKVLPDGCEVFLVDHYGLDRDYERPLRNWARRIAVIDDLANRQHDCDILIDQTYGRAPNDYAALTPANCRILTGTDYALLRPEFSRLRQKALTRHLATSEIKHIIVLAGMTDPKNVTKTVLDGIAQSNLEVTVAVVLGSASPNINTISSYVKKLGDKFTLHIDSRDVAHQMMQADLAIGASGTTAWERCCLGLPTLALVTADNQNVIAYNLSAANISRNLGPVEQLNTRMIAAALMDLFEHKETHHEMVLSSALACDGLGTARTCIALDPKYDRQGRSVTTRRITETDSPMVFAWQTEPNIRRYFRTPDAPTQAEHDAWFRKKLQDPLCVFEMTLVDDRPVGLLRLDPVENTEATYEVSILISTSYQGNAIASTCLKNARRLLPHAQFNAEIHPDNLASEKSFLNAGFSRRDDILVSEPK